MPPLKKTSHAAAPASVPPSKTSHLFSARKPNERAPITHERVAEDIEAFRKAGGKIEVLGVTRTLQRIGADANADEAPSAPARPGVTRKTR